MKADSRAFTVQNPVHEQAIARAAKGKNGSNRIICSS